MSYTSAYLCDFENCRRLADGACAICELHGCYEHLSKALRVLFCIGDGAFKTSDPPPLPPLTHADLPAPVLSFTQFSELTVEQKNLTVAITVAHTRAEKTTRVQTSEHRICGVCTLALAVYDQVGGPAPVRKALDLFIEAARATAGAHALSPTLEPPK